MDEAAHAHCKLSPMWFLWESHLRLVIVMVVMAHFSKKNK
jgi:hypothetical protein